MNSVNRIILSVIILCSSYVLSSAAREGGNCLSRYKAFGINLRPSYVMPTHGYYNGWNPSGKKIRAGGTLDVQFLFSKEIRGRIKE